MYMYRLCDSIIRCLEFYACVQIKVNCTLSLPPSLIFYMQASPKTESKSDAVVKHTCKGLFVVY